MRKFLACLCLAVAIPHAAFPAVARLQVDTKTHALTDELGGTIIDAKSVTLTVGGLTIYDGAGVKTIVTGSTSGAMFGATGNKIGFLGATPIVRPSSTTDLRQALINLGLYTTGGATPLNLNGGALISGSVSSTGVTGPIYDKGGQVFNVRAYGAKVDGVTDDSAAVQAAINAAKPVAGIVFFPTGTCIVTGLVVDGAVTLSGADSSASGGSTLRTVTNAPLLTVTAGCTVEKLTFVGSYNPAFTAQELIVVNNTNDVYLRDLFVTNGYNNIHFKETCFYCYLSRVRFYDSINAGLRTTGTSFPGVALQLYDCVYTGGQASNYGFQFDNVGSLIISTLMFNHTDVLTAGISFNSVASGFGGIQMVNSVVELEGVSTGTAVAITGSNSLPFSLVQLSNTTIAGGGPSGTPVLDLGYVHHSVISSCSFTGPQNGVRINNNVHNVTFQANVFAISGLPVFARGDGTTGGSSLFDDITFANNQYSGAQFLFYSGGVPSANTGNLTIFGGTAGTGTPSFNRPVFGSNKAIRINVNGYNQGFLGIPTMPATGVPFQNNFDVPADVYLDGGTYTNIYINGVQAGAPGQRGPIRIPVGGTIAIDHAADAPVWKWFAAN